MQKQITNAEALQFRQKFVSNGKVTWRVWIVAAALAALILPVEHRAPGWSRPIAVATGAVFGTLIVKRRYWGFPWFWATVAFLMVAQITIVVFTKPWMDVLKYVLMLPVAVVDLFLLSFVIELLASHFVHEM